MLLCCFLTGCSQTADKQGAASATKQDISNVSYLEIAYGEDYTDLEADITFLTSRSDLITDTEAPFEFPDYLKEFLPFLVLLAFLKFVHYQINDNNLFL